MFFHVSVALVFAPALAAASGLTLPEPNKHPAPRNPAHRRLVEEGVQLNDLSDFSAAIRRFEQVLQDNPDDVGALYELSNTLMVSREYKKSLDLAMKGAEYDSELLPDFYGLIASDLDEMGDQKSAIAIYEKGMHSFPKNAGLPFNLGVTFEKMSRTDDARRMYETALHADPKHVSSHYRLAALFERDGYEIPGILAYLRFLELAKDTHRSQQALQSALNHLFGSAQGGKSPNEIDVTVNLGASSKTDEGDFRGPSTFMGLMAALRFTDEGKKLSKPALLVHQVDMLFESFENNKELRKDNKRFAAAYYAAYFRELHKAHHTEAFAYSILTQSGWPEVPEWLGKNTDKLKAYKEWAEAYTWPGAAKQKK
jgi:tetratricopeptide (TPR) repeat protein